MSLNFHKNGNFNYFVKIISVNNLLGQHKRCGMATLLQILISRLIKICKIREIKQHENLLVYGIV